MGDIVTRGRAAVPGPGYLCLTQTRVQNFSSVPGNTSLDITQYVRRGTDRDKREGRVWVRREGAGGNL